MWVGVTTLLACLKARLLECERPASPVAQVQIYSKVHKPPLKVNDLSAFLTTNFRNVRSKMSSRGMRSADCVTPNSVRRLGVREDSC
jgi:hypothetical protein